MAVERTLVIPKLDNDGASLERERTWIENQLLGLAGGFSRHEVHGVWLDDGDVFEDDSYRYFISTDTMTDRRIRERLPGWTALLRQHSLYTATMEVAVEFITAQERAA